MAATAIQELVNDSEESPARTYWVEDDTDPGVAEVTETEAMTAVAAVAPGSLDGSYPWAMRREQINDFYWRITVPYTRRLRALTPQQTSTYQRGFKFAAKPKRFYVGTPIAKAPSTIPNLPDNLAGFEWQGAEFVHRGVLVTPPSVADTLQFVITNSQFSSTYISLVQAMCVDPGTWNSMDFYGRTAGTVCLVSANITKRDDSHLAVAIGLGYAGGYSFTKTDTLNLLGSDSLEFIQNTKTVTIDGFKFAIPAVGGAYQYRFPNFADLNTLIPGP